MKKEEKTPSQQKNKKGKKRLKHLAFTPLKPQTKKPQSISSGITWPCNNTQVKIYSKVMLFFFINVKEKKKC